MNLKRKCQFLSDLRIPYCSSMTVQQVKVEDRTLFSNILEVIITVDLSHRFSIAVTQTREDNVGVAS